MFLFLRNDACSWRSPTLEGWRILAQGEEERSDDVTLGSVQALNSTLQGWRKNRRRTCPPRTSCTTPVGW